jgi:muramoyltetrapeptide carboxypeptidase
VENGRLEKVGLWRSLAAETSGACRLGVRGMVKPRALERGAKIGVLAPAGAVEPRSLRAGVAALEREGFSVEVANGIEARRGYLAGPADKRARSLEEFFSREDISAIFCARGGFGSAQLLPLLGREVIAAHPKIFVGYSDTSLLLNWLAQECGLVAFHGPMVADWAEGLSARARRVFWETLMGSRSRWEVQGGRAVRGGSGRGRLVGGCLSAIVTTLGTPYQLRTAGKILFLEDVGEKPYRVERMLTHLKLAGALEGLEGLVFGSFERCEGEGEREVPAIIEEMFAEAPFPVIADYPAGHGAENVIVPIGLEAELDADSATLSWAEPAVAGP